MKRKTPPLSPNFLTRAAYDDKRQKSNCVSVVYASTIIESETACMNKLKVQRELDSQTITNLISLGDSNFEMDAVHVQVLRCSSYQGLKQSQTGYTPISAFL